MPDRPVSSLDRFAVRGAPVVPAGTMLRVISGIYAAAGSVMLAVAGWGALSGVAPWQTLFPGAMFLLTSGIMTGARRLFRRHFDRWHMSRFKLTPEARGLLRTLSTHLSGWPVGRRLRRMRRRGTLTGLSLLKMIRDRRAEDVVSPESFAVLDTAARAYNRIDGVLDVEMAPGSALEKWAPGMHTASDEAMGCVLHLAANAEAHPENAAMFLGETRPYIEALEELAAHAERLRSSPASVEPTAEGARIHALLEDLRNDQTARTELAETTAAVPVAVAAQVDAEPEQQQVNLS